MCPVSDFYRLLLKVDKNLFPRCQVLPCVCHVLALLIASIYSECL